MYHCKVSYLLLKHSPILKILASVPGVSKSEVKDPRVFQEFVETLYTTPECTALVAKTFIYLLGG